MSDRVNSITIVLEKDIRDDDAQPLIDAIKQFKGVVSVSPNITNPDTHVALMRERARINEKLIEIIKNGI